MKKQDLVPGRYYRYHLGAGTLIMFYKGDGNIPFYNLKTNRYKTARLMLNMKITDDITQEEINLLNSFMYPETLEEYEII